MPGGAVHGAQTYRAPGTTFIFALGTNSGYGLEAAIAFRISASFTFALDSVRSLIFHSRLSRRYVSLANAPWGPPICCKGDTGLALRRQRKTKAHHWRR
jgi:hypothetical protein